MLCEVTKPGQRLSLNCRSTSALTRLTFWLSLVFGACAVRTVRAWCVCGVCGMCRKSRTPWNIIPVDVLRRQNGWYKWRLVSLGLHSSLPAWEDCTKQKVSWKRTIIYTFERVCLSLWCVSYHLCLISMSNVNFFHLVEVYWGTFQNWADNSFVAMSLNGG